MLRLRAASQATTKGSLVPRCASPNRIASEARRIHQAAPLGQPSRQGGASSGRPSARSSNVEASSSSGGGSSAGPSSSSSSSTTAAAAQQQAQAAAAEAAANAARAYTRSLYDPRQRSAQWLRAASSKASSSATTSGTTVGTNASSSNASAKGSSSGTPKSKLKPSVKLSDKRSSSIEQYRTEESIPSGPGGTALKGDATAPGAPGGGSGASASPSSQPSPAAATVTAATSTSSLSPEDLLKQRLRQEQERFERRPMPLGQNEAVLVSAGYGTSGSGIGSGGAYPGASGAAGTTAGTGGSGASTSPSSDSLVQGSLENDHDRRETTAQGSSSSSSASANLESRSIRPPRLENPFDSHNFVQRLLQGGFVPRMHKVMEEAGEGEGEAVASEQTGSSGVEVPEMQGASSSVDDATAPGKAEEDLEEGEELAEGELWDRHGTGQLQTSRRYDPAEAIMEAVRHLIVSRNERVIDLHMNKTQVENESYLFSAALSELRTELQVRARNDATALRSITTLLQREVDALDQKMREDINTLKHDIQVDMNSRKGESKEEQNSLEQEIQDLNNRFTISISDLKTEIEQNIKWDATRRALTLVFGIAIIAVATLTLAEYLGRDAEVAHGAGGAHSGASSGPNAKLGLPSGSTSVGGRPHSVSGATGSATTSGAAGQLSRVGSDSEDSTSYDALLDLAGGGGNVRPKSAEELGLVPKYEDAEAGRYV